VRFVKAIAFGVPRNDKLPLAAERSVLCQVCPRCVRFPMSEEPNTRPVQWTDVRPSDPSNWSGNQLSPRSSERGSSALTRLDST